MTHSPDTLAVRLVRVTYLTEHVSLFEFASLDGAPLPTAAAGAHIALQLPNLGERAYSLVTDSRHPERYAIAVKREPAGRGGSRHMHDMLRVGQVITVTPPRNLFELNEQAEETLLFAGGIGVTPILSMARRLQALNRPFRFFYSSRSRIHAPFLEEIACFPDSHCRFGDEHGRDPSFGQILAGTSRNAHLYCCGPVPMMDDFLTAARAAGFAEEHIHVEYFAAKETPALTGGFVVKLARSNRSLTVKPGQSILSALRAAGVAMTTSCEQGICGACEVRVLSGLPDHRDSVLTDEEKLANQTMMVCCSGALSGELVLDL
ncbi:PDR/VanB family oxidoreductase [Sodalis sp. RH15]|uniref:PDR/VanB family oxidoreductase n=1 Tax=Sodalis sp. RH15 TaxID=3394330 RepID=UPI0039B692F6